MEFESNLLPSCRRISLQKDNIIEEEDTIVSVYFTERQDNELTFRYKEMWRVADFVY